MKKLVLAVALTAASILAVSPAAAAMSNIYRVAGVADDGSAQAEGTATLFSCTNFSGSTVNLQYQIRNKAGALERQVAYSVARNRTHTAATHPVISIVIDENLATGFVQGGSALIRASSKEVVCTASWIDASDPFPRGVALHMLRYNAVSGTQE